MILLIASFLFPLGLSIALFLESKNILTRKIMAITLANTALLFICNYLYFQKEYEVYYPLHSIHAALQFWIFPGIYLYIKSVILTPEKLKNEWWQFLPGAVMLVVATYIFYGYSNHKDLDFFLRMNREGYQFDGFQFTVLIVSRYIHLALVVVQGLIYTILFMFVPKHYNERLRNEFSNIEGLSIDWFNKYNISFISLVGIGFISYALVPLKGYHLPIIIFLFFLFSMNVCVMGIISLKQRRVEVDLDEIDPAVLHSTELEVIKDDALVRKLKNYIEKKQAFLQPDISLTTISRELGTNRTYLSTLINQQYGVNFNTYINRYRVKFANDYLKSNPEVTKEELYHLAGFGSVSTMKRVMKNLR